MTEQEILERSIAKRSRRVIPQGSYQYVVAAITQYRKPGSFAKHLTGPVLPWTDGMTVGEVLEAVVADHDFDTRERMSGVLCDAAE